MEKKMNTTITFKFCDGTTAEMTLTFYMLYQLKNKNKGLYKRYCQIMSNSSKGTYDELDMIVILYVAYLCANPANPMSEKEFIIKCGSDRKAVANAITALTKPKN